MMWVLTNDVCPGHVSCCLDPGVVALEQHHQADVFFGLVGGLEEKKEYFIVSNVKRKLRK